MTPPAGPRYVAYCRVAADKQGRSGLGLEAPREAVARQVIAADGAVVAVFEAWRAAVAPTAPSSAGAAECGARHTVPLIAKLDRIARDAHVLLGLGKAGVEFVAADMPHANRLTVGIMALVAACRCDSPRTPLRGGGQRLGLPAAGSRPSRTWRSPRH